MVLADTILVIHFAFVAFVVGGLAVTLLGAAMRWGWVRNRWFRLSHLACVGLIVFLQWARIPCPLTVWESELRRAAGEAGYETTFLVHWLHPVVFFDFPQGVFDLFYTSFGLLVLLSFWLAPIRWRPGVESAIHPTPAPADHDAAR